MADKYMIREFTGYELDDGDYIYGAIHQMINQIESEIPFVELDDYKPYFLIGPAVFSKVTSCDFRTVVDNDSRELFGIKFDLDPCLSPFTIKLVFKNKYETIYGGRGSKYEWIKFTPMMEEYKMPKIKKVIFNAPATIVFWEDGTKTVVKCCECEHDCNCLKTVPCSDFDTEKSLAMAIVKKINGNKGNYNNIFRKWCNE